MITKIVTWLIAYVLPGFMLLGGISGLWISTHYLLDAYSSAAWPQTVGMVIRSELGSESEFKRDEDRTRFWPIVEFQYEVDGTTFRSSNVTLDGLRSGPHIGTGRDHAEEVLRQYPVDTQVNVHYDAETPERAVLNTGVSISNFFVPSFSLVLIVISSVWLWFMLFARSATSGQDESWRGKERVCPECRTAFTSVQDKGSCPKCQHVFLASEVMSLAKRSR